MIRINENYTKLKASYLFSDIAKRVSAYVAANPDKPVIRLGIGDVTEPLPPVCIAAMHAATDEMANVLGYDETRLTIPDPQLLSETTSNFRRVRVEVTYRFEMIVDWPGISREHDLTRAVEMRVVR